MAGEDLRWGKWPSHYHVLGVSPEASREEIRRAYRRLAALLHPDVSGGLPAAEERFRTLAGAYGVLVDPTARRGYDAGLPPPPRGWRRTVGAVVGSFLDALQAPDGAPGPVRGSDRSVRLRLAFEVAILGGQRTVELPLSVPCRACGGVGGHPEPRPVACHVCGGAGYGRETGLLSAPKRLPCPLCRGAGVLHPRLCRGCEATGRVLEPRTLSLRVPPGARSGERICVAGRGEAGRNSGPPGDLHVVVQIEEHALLVRAGADLHVDVPLSIGEATRGARVPVPSLEGPLTVDLPPEVEMPHTARFRGRGVPDDAGNRGELCVHFFVEPPHLRSDAQRDALRILDEGDAGRTYPLRARFRQLVHPGDPSE